MADSLRQDAPAETAGEQRSFRRTSRDLDLVMTETLGRSISTATQRGSLVKAGRLRRTRRIGTILVAAVVISVGATWGATALDRNESASSRVETLKDPTTQRPTANAMQYVRFSAKHGSKTRGEWLVDDARQLLLTDSLPSGPIEFVAVPTTADAVCFLTVSDTLGTSTACSRELTQTRPYSVMSTEGVNQSRVLTGIVGSEVKAVEVVDDESATTLVKGNAFAVETSQANPLLKLKLTNGSTISVGPREESLPSP